MFKGVSELESKSLDSGREAGIEKSTVISQHILLGLKPWLCILNSEMITTQFLSSRDLFKGHRILTPVTTSIPPHWNSPLGPQTWIQPLLQQSCIHAVTIYWTPTPFQVQNIPMSLWTFYICVISEHLLMLAFPLCVSVLRIWLESSSVPFNAHFDITAIVRTFLTSHLLPREKSASLSSGTLDVTTVIPASQHLSCCLVGLPIRPRNTWVVIHLLIQHTWIKMRPRCRRWRPRQDIQHGAKQGLLLIYCRPAIRLPTLCSAWRYRYLANTSSCSLLPPRSYFPVPSLLATQPSK